MTGRTFVGAVLRRLRRERGLSQAALARSLGLSPSYVNQLEHDRRAASGHVLDLLRSRLGVTVTPLDRGARARLAADLHEALVVDGDGDTGDLAVDDADLAALADTLPGVARAVVGLHRRFRDSRARLVELTDAHVAGLDDRTGDSRARSSREPAIPREARPGEARSRETLPREALPREALPHEQVRDFFYDRHHYVDRLDRAAEDLARAEHLVPGDLAGPLAEVVARRLGATVRTAPAAPAAGARPGAARPDRAYDPAARTLVLSPELGPGQRAFQLATQLFLSDRAGLSDLLDEIAGESGVRGTDARRLLRIGLANYAAGALLMPYGDFRAAAEEERYDVEVLAQRFGVGFETVCHRLSTLQRPGLRGVPFSFVRVDRAGNVSKRQSATDWHFSRSGGGCPRWVVHEAFTRPGEILTQIAAMPDGRRYLWLAKVVRGRPRPYGAPRRSFAVGLGCALGHARRVVYADGLVLTDPRRDAPVGPGCRVCERVACTQRAFPLIGAGLHVTENERSGIPYAPADGPAGRASTGRARPR